MCYFAEQSIGMLNQEWNNLRTRLHHDWLQNRFMTFLMSLKNSSDPIKDIDDVSEQLGDWRKKEAAFKTLIESAEDALSPRQLLDRYPLDAVPEESRIWLGGLIHSLYCQRTGIKESVLVLDSSISQINNAFNALLSALQSGKIPEQSESAKTYKIFSVFSAQISKLPHGIQVV